MAYLENLMQGIVYIIPFLIVLTVLVFLHELGHYWVARKNGVRVEIFSIGFGPEIFGWTDKSKTRWKFCLIPLGGYVKMLGDADAASTPDNENLKKMSEKDKKEALPFKTVWQRIAVVAAGPIANILLCMLLLFVVYTFRGESVRTPIIGMVEAGGLGDLNGLQRGDKILEINGKAIERFDHIRRHLNKDNSLKVLKVARGGDNLSIAVMLPEEISTKESILTLGVKPEIQKHSIVSAFWTGIKNTVEFSGDMLKFFGRLVSGGEDRKSLGSIIAIAKSSQDFWQEGFIKLLEFMALISLNLGILNLFPIPMLDGGHLVFYFIEAVRGRPVTEKKQELAFKVGFFLLISFMIFALWNDVDKYKIISKITSLFA